VELGVKRNGIIATIRPAKESEGIPFAEDARMPTQITESRPADDWTQVFESMQESLTQTLAATPELDTINETAPTDFPTTLHDLDQQLARLQASLDEAERRAAETDAWLRSEAEALQRWLDSLQVNQRKLAEWAGRAV
jgi:chromosome segregation ATPase